ncbi:nucleoside triphosphate pyrophosphohydrolase [Amphibacillus indicireducens]|uniref:Nucleoside triphosphate pyrophosphohydrolase n=1 Tax=Amphibacillus indicireducens TaxID=1076330 RepID=A0ABP7VWU1_9BACI
MSRIEVIGLGAGDIDQLSLGVYRKLTASRVPLFVRTEDHPVLKSLKAENIDFQGFDSIYQTHDQFEAVYDAIVAELISQAKQHQLIRYAVPGHPMLAERTIQLLLDQTDVKIEISGGQSFLDDLFSAVKIDPIEGFQFLDATSFERAQIDYTSHLIFCQVYDQMIASEVKLTLLEDLPPEHPIVIVEAAGSVAENIKHIPLVELDQVVHLSNLTSVYIKPINKDALSHQFNQFREVIATLRGPNGCPWDQKQTHQSLRMYLIEEAYELIDAIDQEDDNQIIEELGDVFLQVMLHSQIGEDQGYFTIDDVIRSITEKMIRRHPHVFANGEAADAQAVKENWQIIKANEQGMSERNSLLDRVPRSASSIVVADAYQKEAAKVGFDWQEPEPVFAKITEELAEVMEAVKQNQIDQIEAEFGDLLFSVINLARHYQVNSDLALNRTNQKFKHRFQFIEARVIEQGKQLTDLSLLELDQIWEEAKKLLKEEG